MLALGLGRRDRIPSHIVQELRLAGFHIRRRRTWLNKTQITERVITIRVRK
jgi:hypothetical protein